MWWRCVFEDELRHHGVKGQKWGVRNGPPYPLDRKRAKRVDKFDISEYNKSNANIIENTLHTYGNRLLTDVRSFTQSGKLVVSSKLAGNADNIKRIGHSETIDESLRKANPLRGSEEGNNNCVAAAICGYMRRQGYDVIARSTGGEPQNAGGIAEECFKGLRTLDGSAIKFGKSPKDAAELLVKKYGLNAEGICGVQWKNKSAGGHCFNWVIKNGSVSFIDYQQGNGNVEYYWDYIDPYDSLTLARLDGREINIDAVFKYVEENK